MGGDPYRPFRPRAARVVCLVLGVVVLALMAVIAGLLPMGVGDRLAFVGLGLLVAAFLFRLGEVRAVPARDSLTVRNILLTRRLAWPEVVSVRFGPDRPWVQLDLADGQTLAVMAVQRADGVRALAEARRLAALVVRNSPTPRDD